MRPRGSRRRCWFAGGRCRATDDRARPPTNRELLRRRQRADLALNDERVATSAQQPRRARLVFVCEWHARPECKRACSMTTRWRRAASTSINASPCSLNTADRYRSRGASTSVGRSRNSASSRHCKRRAPRVSVLEHRRSSRCHSRAQGTCSGAGGPSSRTIARRRSRSRRHRRTARAPRQQRQHERAACTFIFRTTRPWARVTAYGTAAQPAQRPAAFEHGHSSTRCVADEKRGRPGVAGCG